MPDLLQTIKNSVAKEKKSVFVERWDDLGEKSKNALWPEVCKRYALLVAEATLGQAAINTQHHHPGADTACITDPTNIVL